MMERTFGAAPVAARFIASMSCRGLRNGQLFQFLFGFLFYLAAYPFFCIPDDQSKLSAADRGFEHSPENFLLEQ